MPTGGRHERLVQREERLSMMGKKAEKRASQYDSTCVSLSRLPLQSVVTSRVRVGWSFKLLPLVDDERVTGRRHERLDCCFACGSRDAAGDSPSSQSVTL